jgi:RNA polymerase sigma-70 factor (ECF subfamily)
MIRLKHKETVIADDYELLIGLRARRPKAFRELFDLYSDRMFRLAAGMLTNDDAAEDVVREAFRRFFENLDSFEGLSQVGTWLYRTVHNANVDRLRRCRPTLALMDAGDGLMGDLAFYEKTDPVFPLMRIFA